MIAILTFTMTSGLGDSYNAMFRAYTAQEYLKKLGYQTTTYITINVSPYLNSNHNIDIFKKIFKLSLFDNLNIIPNDIIIPEKYSLIFNNDNIFKVYVKEKLNIDYIFNNFYLWQESDDFPNYNLISDDVLNFCENKIKQFPDNFYSIHYRVFELDDKKTFFNKNITMIQNFLDENKNIPIFVCSSDNDFKSEIIKLNFKNIFFNNYEFPENWYTRSYDWTEDKLVEFFKETIFEMYALSKSPKILRLCIWFSGFLFFSNAHNKSSISNKLRYFPPYR